MASKETIKEVIKISMHRMDMFQKSPSHVRFQRSQMIWQFPQAHLPCIDQFVPLFRNFDRLNDGDDRDRDPNNTPSCHFHVLLFAPRLFSQTAPGNDKL